jgi:hypothetical protein
VLSTLTEDGLDRPQELYHTEQDGFIGAEDHQPEWQSHGQHASYAKPPGAPEIYAQHPKRRRRQQPKAGAQHVEEMVQEGEAVDEVVEEVMHEFMDTLTVLSPGAQDRRLASPGGRARTKRAQSRERQEAEVIQVMLFQTNP